MKQQENTIGVSEHLVFMNCNYCRERCQKAGRQKNGAQKLYCKVCKKYQQNSYQYQACKIEVVAMIPKLVCESVSIRGIARILKLSLATVIGKVKLMAASIKKPAIPLNRIAFEPDEIRTYVRNKENQYWIAYALCSESRQVVDFIVGKRSKRSLKVIVDNLLLSGVSTIKTDKLNIYQTLIPKEKHISKAYNTNHIERNNLTIRTHLKRLSRRTICYSKSKQMLESCLKLYFWGRRY